MARKVFAVLVVASCGFLVAAIPARAHHSFPAVFDANKPVSVTGVVTEIRLTNPHSWFYLDATDANGKVVRWEFEGATPTSLIRSGVKPGTFKVGDKVTIKGSHAMIERYRRVDADTLEVEVTLEDPKVLTGPWKAPKSTLKLAPFDAIMGTVCENTQTAALMEAAAEDNYGRKK